MLFMMRIRVGSATAEAGRGAGAGKAEVEAEPAGDELGAGAGEDNNCRRTGACGSVARGALIVTSACRLRVGWNSFLSLTAEIFLPLLIDLMGS